MEKLILSILRLLNGNERLFVSFWYVYIPILLITNIPRFLDLHVNVENRMPILILFIILFFILKAFSLVSLWRCAPNVLHNSNLKTRLARGLVVANSIYLLFVAAILTVTAFHSFNN